MDLPRIANVGHVEVTDCLWKFGVGIDYDCNLIAVNYPSFARRLSQEDVPKEALYSHIIVCIIIKVL